jgi:hypothetical protein
VVVTPRPWRWGKAWSPEEVAAELKRQRAELVAKLSRKPAARGLSEVAREEVVNDAMTAVVMESSRPILNGEHLLGAFWMAADFRLRRYHEGRHLTRLGGRERVEMDAGVEASCAVDGVSEQVELVDRMRRATDWFAELDDRERLVVSVMASNGVGPRLASRLLGLSFSEVRSASRSARYAKSTIDGAFSSLSAILGYAMNEQRIETNVAYRMRVDPDDPLLNQSEDSESGGTFPRKSSRASSNTSSHNTARYALPL